MGHLYVVHGDLTRIAADGVLVPCDAYGEVLPHWKPFDRIAPESRLRAEVTRSRVSRLHRDRDGRPVWFVNSGTLPDRSRNRWLAAGVRTGVRTAVSALEGTEAANRRGRPLLAMPLFGTGAGGFGARRGEALTAHLSAVREEIDGHDVDAVIVCWDRADYAALQGVRTRDQWSLPTVLVRQAELLARAARERRLALFLGAGVSVAAGIGDFAGLVASLEIEAGLRVRTATSSKGLARRVDAIQAAKSEEWVREHVHAAVSRPRYALLHGLLASLRVEEAVTTNFDTLYELAGTRPFEKRLQVLPWSRTRDRRPWLLKVHGDTGRNHRLVLDSASFAAFESERPTVAGILRSLLAQSREVLFVGYRLDDPNIKALVSEAVAFHAQYGVAYNRLGTIISLESSDRDPGENPVRLGFRRAGEDSVTAAALRLQEFVDHIGWSVARTEDAWLLDPRYSSLHRGHDRDRAAELARFPLPDSERWRSLRAALDRRGRPSG